MVRDANDTLHKLRSALSIIRGQVQLLHRQLRCMDGFSNRDRHSLEAGLSIILTAARSLRTIIEQDPARREDRSSTAVKWVDSASDRSLP
jgi:hypothetical protein